jgi:hypothetical protein
METTQPATPGFRPIRGLHECLVGRESGRPTVGSGFLDPSNEANGFRVSLPGAFYAEGTSV